MYCEIILCLCDVILNDIEIILCFRDVIMGNVGLCYVYVTSSMRKIVANLKL